MSNEKPSAWARFKAAFSTFEQESQAVAPNVTPGAVTQAALEPSAELVAENERLKADLAKLEAEQKLRDEEKAKADAENAAKLETERAARIETEADAFVLKCANAGKAATDALRIEFVEAKQAGDNKRVARLDAIASSYVVPGAEARVPASGPSADEIAERSKGMSDEAIVPQAVRTLKAAGITPKSPDWSTKLGAEILKIKNGESHVA